MLERPRFPQNSGRGMRNHSSSTRTQQPYHHLLPALLAGIVLVLTSMACSLPSPIGRLVRAGENPPTPATAASGTRPTVQLSPAQGPLGSQITAMGQRWQPDGSVLLRLENPTTGEGQQSIYADASVGADGTFTALVTIPTDLPWQGLNQLQVRAWSPTTGESATALFSLAASNGAIGTPGTTSAPGDGTPPPASTAIPGSGNTRLAASVAPGGVNLRSGPGTAYPVISPLPGGTLLSVLGQNNAGDWLYVRLADDQAGWAYRTYTDFRGTAPVVAAPPVPQPTAAAPTPTPKPSATPAITQWRGEYFANANLVGTPVLTRNDPAIGFDWGTAAPAAGLPTDNFSARWTRTLSFDGELYRFHAIMDDGARVYLDNGLIINDWRDGALREVTTDIRLATGPHDLRVEYYEHSGGAQVRLWWELATAYPDWKGEYWSNPGLSGNPLVVRNDTGINFAWNAGSPDSRIPSDHFSARWTRLQAFESGTYRFHLVMDDGARLWVDDRLLIDRWYDGATREVTSDLGLAAGTHELRIEYYESTGGAQISAWWEKVSVPSYPDWKGEYWSNPSLSGAPALVRNDTALDFNWAAAAPAAGLPADRLSARWSRWVTFTPGTYRFSVRADDGIRAYVDGQRIIDQWHDGDGDITYQADQVLDGAHWLTVEYYENTGGASLKFWWYPISLPTATPTKTPTPVSPTATSRPTATATSTATPTSRPTATATWTPTATPTMTTRPTSAPVINRTATATATRTPTATATSKATFTATAAATRTPGPTRTATATPTATTATPAVRLNELLLVPGRTDWTGDGLMDADDQWVELRNECGAALDLGGWSLQVSAPLTTTARTARNRTATPRPRQPAGDTQPETFVIPDGTVIKACGYQVFYGADLNLLLRTGDLLLLRQPDGQIADRVLLPKLLAAASYSRDGQGNWYTDRPPSPGDDNLPPSRTRR